MLIIEKIQTKENAAAPTEGEVLEIRRRKNIIRIQTLHEVS